MVIPFVVHSQPETRGGVIAAEVERRGNIWKDAGADGTRPFRLCGEAILHLRLLVEPEDEKLHLIAGNVGHGQVIVGFPVGLGAHDFVPQPPRNLVLGDVKAFDSGA